MMTGWVAVAERQRDRVRWRESAEVWTLSQQATLYQDGSTGKTCHENQKAIPDPEDLARSVQVIGFREVKRGQRL